MMKPALRRISGAILAAALVMTACTSDGIAIEDLPPLATPAPTSTVRPVATRPPTTVPTEVPATPTVEPTATAMVEPTPTPTTDTERDVNPDVPDLIVDGAFTWPPGAPALTVSEQDGVNLGVSFLNLMILASGRGPDAFQTEYQALQPHLTPPALAQMDTFREGVNAAPVIVTPGKEEATRIPMMRVTPSGDQASEVALCFNAATFNEGRGDIETTVVFIYDALLLDGTWMIGGFNVQAVDPFLRDCTEAEMQS